MDVDEKEEPEEVDEEEEEEEDRRAEAEEHNTNTTNTNTTNNNNNNNEEDDEDDDDDDDDDDERDGGSPAADNDDGDGSYSTIPTEMHGLRACLLCSLIKTFEQFHSHGCENCEPVLDLRGRSGRILKCTTASFSGMAAYMQPEKSWVVRWQRISNFPKRYVNGVYAVGLTGKLPPRTVENLRKEGVIYRPREGKKSTST